MSRLSDTPGGRSRLHCPDSTVPVDSHPCPQRGERDRPDPHRSHRSPRASAAATGRSSSSTTRAQTAPSSARNRSSKTSGSGSCATKSTAARASPSGGGCSRPRGDLRLMCDADCVTSLRSLPLLEKATEEVDVAVGSRLSSRGPCLATAAPPPADRRIRLHNPYPGGHGAACPATSTADSSSGVPRPRNRCSNVCTSTAGPSTQKRWPWRVVSVTRCARSVSNGPTGPTHAFRSATS